MRAPDPVAAASPDALVAAEAAVLARRADALALPPPDLDGWQSLCAGEYATAVRALRDSVSRAVEALRAASAST